MIDGTHDQARRCWVPGADGHPDFPIQNLPFGVFSPPGGAPRGGVAIGDMILDLQASLQAGLFSGEAKLAAEAASGPALNPFLALGAAARRALRARLVELLEASGADAGRAEPALHKAADCTLHIPARIGGYTDFYAGIHHATNAGKLFRPDNPLLPNYKWVPIAYHGRASSIVASGTSVRRPNGQRNNQPGAVPPVFGPSRRLDYELELGIWVGPGNALGEPVPLAGAAEHIAGFCLLNDWSARDIQAWEYQPLGPFLAKNFASTISPWIVTAEALAPFRVAVPPRPEGDPAPLPYLTDATDAARGALDLTLRVALSTSRMREQGLAPLPLTACNARDLYWTVAQMLAHHTSGGCNLQPGDLMGTGTITSPVPNGFGSLLELTQGGKQEMNLPSGETRTFLEDGDEVIFTARAERNGFAAIGFGPCAGRILPAPS